MPPLVARTSAVVTLSFVLLAPSRAAAQQRESPAGWSIYPSVSIGVVYNDNLFFRREGTQPENVYTRFGAEVDAIHRGRTSSFSGGYALTGDIFPGELEDLSTTPSSQQARFDVSSKMGTKSSVSAAAAYIVSRSPSEVFDPIGIELGRRRAEGYSATVSYQRQLSAGRSFGVGYGFGFRKLDSRFETAGISLESTSHTVRTNWDQGYSQKTTGSLRYFFRVFVDESVAPLLDLPKALKSHAVTYGWTHQLTPRTTLSAHAGPNFFEDFVLGRDGEILADTEWRITPEASASIERSWETTSLTIGYGRTQNQFLGGSGRLTTQGLSIALDFDPSRIFSFGVTTGAQRSSQGGETIETYRAGASASLEIARWWTLRANYSYAFQERFFGFFGEEADLTGGRSRNQAYVGIVIGKTVPLE